MFETKNLRDTYKNKSNREYEIVGNLKCVYFPLKQEVILNIPDCASSARFFRITNAIT